MGFNRWSIENRLIFTDRSIDIFITDRDSPKLFEFIIAKYFRDDARISKGKDDHKEKSKSLKNGNEENKIPVFWASWKDVEEGHANYDGEHSTEIFSWLRNHESIFGIIFIVWHFCDFIDIVFLAFEGLPWIRW